MRTKRGRLALRVLRLSLWMTSFLVETCPRRWNKVNNIKLTRERTRVFDMVDNFDIIKPLLKFNDHQDFSFLQLLLRKKDGNNNYNNNT